MSKKEIQYFTVRGIAHAFITVSGEKYSADPNTIGINAKTSNINLSQTEAD
jgi:hypothetical protein